MECPWLSPAKTQEKLLEAWLSLRFLLCINVLRVDETWCGQTGGLIASGSGLGFGPASLLTCSPCTSLQVSAVLLWATPWTR